MLPAMRFWCIAAIGAASLGMAPGALGADEPPAAEAEPDAYQQGTRLAAQGRWAEAAEQFRAAIAVRDSAAARFNLAQAERNVGRLATAKREFLRARELAERENASDVARLAEEALAGLEQRIFKLVLETPEMVGLEARVDGRPVPARGTIELDPGRHDLVVTAPGRDPFVRRVVAQQGKRLVVRVGFANEEPAAPSRTPAPKPQPSSAHADAGARPPLGAILLGGVGAAAFTTAALLHLHRNDKLAEAGQGCDKDADGFVCPQERKSDPEHRELRDAADRAELGRNVLLGVGVGAWTAGALWWLLDSGSSERPVSAAVAPARRGVSVRARIVF